MTSLVKRGSEEVLAVRMVPKGILAAKGKCQGGSREHRRFEGTQEIQWNTRRSQLTRGLGIRECPGNKGGSRLRRSLDRKEV